MLGGFVIVALTGLLSAQALAQTPVSIDTELTKGRCRFIDDDGEVGHYALKRCPGLAGARVYTIAGVQRVSLSFRWGKTWVREIVENWSIGDKLEWRGIRDKQGFKPYATFVRVIVKDDTTEERHNVLAVIRMEPRNACLMAAIDEAANADPKALARSTADAEARGVACGKHKPKIVGNKTRWAEAVIGPGEPPPDQAR